MDAIRKEEALVSAFFFGMTMVGMTLMKLLSALPHPHSMQLVVLEFLVLFLGCIIPPIYSLQFGFSFVEDVIEIRLWSSTWTWLMQFETTKKIVNKFVMGNYVGFKRLCLLLIVVCIVVYAVPYFHSEGLMSLPAVSMFFSVVFIMKG